MRANHIKGWLTEARKKEKEDVAADQKAEMEGTMEVLGGMGGEGTEEIGGKMPAEMSNCKWVVDLVHTDFGEGRLAEENTWQAVVLIPKGKREYCGIGLVEVMWKVVAVILNHRLTASITFHEFFHGFRCGSWHGQRHPRGQTYSAVRGLEGGGPVRDLSGPAQGV